MDLTVVIMTVAARTMSIMSPLDLLVLPLASSDELLLKVAANDALKAIIRAPGPVPLGVRYRTLILTAAFTMPFPADVCVSVRQSQDLAIFFYLQVNPGLCRGRV